MVKVVRVEEVIVDIEKFDKIFLYKKNVYTCERVKVVVK